MFFTGKGGVGKTSLSCATAIALADAGRKVLLISTDPASNLDEVLGTPLSSAPQPVSDVPGLQAMNINPITAAAEYRERMIAPLRGILPQEALRQMEEQLSGGCTVEIAGFNEFAGFLGDPSKSAPFDHILLDTAPTGHTLRLLNLPAAWDSFIANNQTGSSCLGPVSGLQAQKTVYENALTSLRNPAETLLVLVSRAESMSLREANRTSLELLHQGLSNQHLIVNGLFSMAPPSSSDAIAGAFARRCAEALNGMPGHLAGLPRTVTPFYPGGLIGIPSLRAIGTGSTPVPLPASTATPFPSDQILPWSQLLNELAQPGKGVIMTMGKGGVGKTTMAAAIAVGLARRGCKVKVTTTDPAAHLTSVLDHSHKGIEVERIDPAEVTKAYVEGVIAHNRGKLDSGALALLEEEMRSPCVEEIAVFQAFARTIADGTHQFVVVDTAPTGHTLLLLDAAEAYHREVSKSAGDLPDEIKNLLPRLRDPAFSRVVLVALPEATPTHEAVDLQRDLERAGIHPFAWIINQSFLASGTTNPLLLEKGLSEEKYIREICAASSRRAVLMPWMIQDPIRPEDILRVIEHTDG